MRSGAQRPTAITPRYPREVNDRATSEMRPTKLLYFIRWLECIKLTTFYFGAKVSEIYAYKYHGTKVKGATELLIENLRTSFATLINEANWMDKGTVQDIYSYQKGIT